MPFTYSFRVLALGAFALIAAAALTEANATDHPHITVTRFDDPQPPDACSPEDCSLREAAVLANHLPGRDTVILAVGTYNQDFGYGGADAFYEDGGLVGDIDVTDDLDILGAGVDETTVTTPWCCQERAFEVLPGATLRVFDLTVAHLPHSFHPADCGRAFRNRGGVLALERVKLAANVMRGSGGGICNEEGGTLTVRDSSFVGNTAALTGRGGGIMNRQGSVILERVLLYGNSADVADGGGIYSAEGTLVVKDSLIKGNETDQPFGTRRGGGIAAGGSVVLTNVTVSGNHSEGTYTEIGEPDSRGGGLYLWGQATLTNVTITDNDSETSGGGMYIAPGAQVTLTNTIIAGNTGGDCEGPITSTGHNLDGDGSCALNGPGDITGVDPMLAPLADNGGPTETHAPLPGSPAVDAGDDAACLETDQRAALRPIDGDGDGSAICDIGSFEAGAMVPTPLTPIPTATPPPPAVTGDADCSGGVHATDALWILRFSAAMGPYAECLFAANLNCDLQVDAVDALLILRHVAAMPVEQPPGCPTIGPP